MVVALSATVGLGTAIQANVRDVRQWYARAMVGDVFLTDGSAADAEVVGQHNLAAELAAQAGVAAVHEMRFLPSRIDGTPAVCVVRDLAKVDLPWAADAKASDEARRRLLAGETALASVLARKLGAKPGDVVRLEVQGRQLSLRVAALVNDYLLGGSVAYLDQRAVEKQLALGPADFYIVEARRGTAGQALAERFERTFDGQGIVVQSLAEMRSQLDALVDGIVGALWALLAVGFVVGGIGVGNTLTLNVLEQTRELGLLRLIGMTPGQVRKLVFCESLLLGVLGVLLGLAGGVTTAIVIYVCNEPVLGRAIEFSLDVRLLGLAAAGGLMLAIVAAWRPASRAARLDVLAAIAYE
jgi:putative ABC transport system permease protein